MELVCNSVVVYLDSNIYVMVVDIVLFG
jgi:hypothetical protein